MLLACPSGTKASYSCDHSPAAVLSPFLLSYLIMTSRHDEIVAKALNSCRNDSLYMLGRAYSSAMELLSEFIDLPGSAQPPEDSKYFPTHE